VTVWSVRDERVVDQRRWSWLPCTQCQPRRKQRTGKLRASRFVAELSRRMESYELPRAKCLIDKAMTCRFIRLNTMDNIATSFDRVCAVAFRELQNAIALPMGISLLLLAQQATCAKSTKPGGSTKKRHYVYRQWLLRRASISFSSCCKGENIHGDIWCG
jgi:hypothetical protein